MGLFNEVRVKVGCPSCGNKVLMSLQFDYGAVRQYKYQVGDCLLWYGARGDTGEICDGCVVVDAASYGHCPTCGHEGFWEFYLIVFDNRILGALPAPPGTAKTVYGKQPFIRLGPPDKK